MKQASNHPGKFCGIVESYPRKRVQMTNELNSDCLTRTETFGMKVDNDDDDYDDNDNDVGDDVDAIWKQSMDLCWVVINPLSRVNCFLY